MRSNIIMSILLIGILSGCYKDKGNYDYAETKPVKIAFVNYTYSRAYGSPLKITPRLTYADESDTLRYKFEWWLNGEVIGTDRNIDVESFTQGNIGFNDALYTVIDTVAGQRYYYNFLLNLTSPFMQGWLFLSENATKSELHYIRRDMDNGKPKYVLFKNIYSMFNKDELGSDPVKLVEHYGGSNSRILVIQNGQDGSVEIDGNSMVKSILTKNEFIGDNFPAGFKHKDAAFWGYTNFMMDSRGNLYSRYVSTPSKLHSARFSPNPTYIKGGMNATQFITPNNSNTSFGIVYDNLNKRYIGLRYAQSQINGSDGNLIPLSISGEYPDDYTHIDNLGDRQLIYAQSYNCQSLKARIYSILKHNEQYRLHSFDVDATSYTFQCKPDQEIDFAGGDLITKNSKFCLLRNRPYLFFTAGEANDKIYYYDMDTKRVKLYHDLNGKNIVDFAQSKAMLELGVATTDGSFYLFNISNEVIADNRSEITYTVSGLGNVISFIRKYGSSSNFSSQL